ncbi:MFS transporter [Dictyobacter formicarum]|uniref:MFS transporter n=1 Tax=Dictyobacter formicarum TaxID=2778368 RepID=A0ABQ3VAB2_9CHLR|nr:MFS transporter [Dictyobacter formicarum]GHO82171.1 MFS transporter [Dictyobacter formicarum]
MISSPQMNQEFPTFMVHGKPARPWLALLALVFGLFMALLDATIVTIALPTIQHSLQTDLSTVSWVLNAYNLGFAVLLVTIGRFADQHGRKRFFLLGMVLFSLGSLACATAQWLGNITGTSAIGWLIASRALQAIGAAGLTPVSLAIITAIFPPQKRGAAIGVWGALAGLAAAVGPVLGGFLVQQLGWGWIFFVNLPFCAIGLVMVFLFVPETRALRTSKRVDLLGVITLTIGLCCLMLAMMEGNDWGWVSVPVLALFGGALLGAFLFGYVEFLQRKQDPMVDFSLFKTVSFSGANVTMFLFSVAVQGAFLILVLYLMNTMGYGQLQAAYALLPMPLAQMGSAAVLGRMSQKVNPYLVGVIGMFGLSVGFVLLCLLPSDASYPNIAWRMVLLGVSSGMLFQSQPGIALAEIPRARLGVGSGVFNTFRQIGFALGVAVLLSVFVGQIPSDLNQAHDDVIGMVQHDSRLPAQLRIAIITHLRETASTDANASNAEGASGNTTSYYDLTKLSDQLPPAMPTQTRASVRTELRLLSIHINTTFQEHIEKAYKASWWVAASVGLAGMLSALLTLFASRKSSSIPAHEEQTEEAGVGVI